MSIYQFRSRGKAACKNTTRVQQALKMMMLRNSTSVACLKQYRLGDTKTCDCTAEENFGAITAAREGSCPTPPRLGSLEALARRYNNVRLLRAIVSCDNNNSNRG